MGKVISLDEHRTTKALSGTARCLHCYHEWQALVPIGTHCGLECPSCHLFKGALIALVSPPEQRVWECDCGGQLFQIPEGRGPCCVLCGLEQNF